jgi:valyl-tRNA synthetase
MEKNYDHTQFEDALYKKWEESGVFTPPTGEELKKSGQKPFTIIMPPPNASDPMHIGNAMGVVVEDIFIRYHRMKGEAALWVPGTDHAGIETQYVFEKRLSKEGKSRFDFDRETLYKMIWEYVQGNINVVLSQMKKIGASADWSRVKFTLDKDIVKEVITAFKKLHEDGLIYRAEKLVNYCTKCGTTYSELEVEHEDREDKLYTIDYGLLKVATTRPETMLGDTAVAVNPKDKRFSNLIGKTIMVPLTNREIPIVGDEMVDIKFGTGAVKITPAHDPNDWEVGVRHHLPIITVIGTNGKMTEEAGEYAGLSVSACREKVISDLGEKLTDIKPYLHNVGVCYRCHRAIEPLPIKQFFIKVKPLAEKALAALDSKETKILGAGRDKILRHWLNNLRDWNISRQIVWGIRIPVWYKDESKTDFIVSETSPGDGYIQETDTFDTWFSSGQWPVVTLKTNRPGDFDAYYPTDVMETGYDILPFWVMRMMMLSIYLTGKSPFKQVYLHGLVRDEKGQKMSKSKGNAINPLYLCEKYGTDSLRMALVMSTTAGQDSNTGENKVRGMRNFGNKIWNAGRFVVEKSKEDVVVNGKMDGEFVSKLSEVVTEVSKLLDDLKVGLASETIYSEFWHWFCDEAIEMNKQKMISDEVLKNGYKTMLILLHPFVPFVTEAVWHEMFVDEGMLISYPWPK